MKYLLSVIIPTKNRSYCLIGCINSLIAIASDEIEIVIQDNSDDNTEIYNYIKNIKCKNIKYFYTNKKLTQTENSELAVSHSTGKYVCYIGDDDSISKYLVEVVKLMAKNGIEALNCNMATFYWPDVVFSGKVLPYFSFDKTKIEIRKIESSVILDKYLSQGFQSIRYLPRTYHGVIARSVLDRVKSKSGSFFPGPSPDMANAVACALIVTKQIYINEPLIISGACYSSACGMGMRGAHKGSLKVVAQIADDVEDKWNQKLPKLWLGNTIWPESAIKALESMESKDLVKEMNWNAVYARMLLKYGEYRKYTMQFIYGINYLKVLWIMFKDAYNWLADKLRYKVRVMSGDWYVNNQNNISLQDACNITDRYLEEINFLDKIRILIYKKES